MRTRLSRLAATGVLLLSAVACEGTTDPEPPIAGPYTIAVVSGEGASTPRGVLGPVVMVVELRDVHGRIAPNTDVRWFPDTDSSAEFVTDSAGRARIRLQPRCDEPLEGVIQVRANVDPANEVWIPYSVVPGQVITFFDADSAVLVAGETAPATVIPRDVCGSMPPPAGLAWSSSVTGVVALQGSSVLARELTAVAPGRTSVIVTGGGVTDTLRVSVFERLVGMRTIAMGSRESWQPGFGCGLDDDGDVHCWGGSGWTSAGESWTTYGASEVLTGYGFTRITASNVHLCALEREGAAYCWGTGAGAVGDGTSTARLQPVPVGGSLRFTDISASISAHTCAITPDGVAWCWGTNGSGQLGDGTTAPRLEPVAVATSLRFNRIVTSRWFTCALTPDGATYCWGRGPDPWGTFEDKVSPTPVRLTGAPLFKDIAAGFSTACGLALDGEAWCWGNPVVDGIDQLMPASANVPVRVPGTRRYEALAVGVTHACATTAAGEVDCWGGTVRAQLGVLDGTTSRFSAAPLPVPPLTKVFAGSGSYTTCGITSAGGVYCWGELQSALQGYPGAVVCSWGTGISRRTWRCATPLPVPVAGTAALRGR